MKKYRENWQDTMIFIEYIYKGYEPIGKTCCKNCNVFNNLHYNGKYTISSDSKYLKTCEGEIVHFDSIPKKCNNYCIYYY